MADSSEQEHLVTENYSQYENDMQSTCIEEHTIFKYIAETANYGIAVVNNRGHIIFINNYFAEVHQRSVAESYGKHLSIFHTPEQMNFVKELQLRLAADGEYSSTEVWHVKKDGTEFPMLMTGNIIPDDTGKPLYFFTNAIDITIQKEAETALVNSQNMLNTILQNMPGGMILIGEDYRIVTVNCRTCDITGYSKEELVGNLCDTICPKGSESKECPIWAKGAKGFQEMDTAVKNKDGRKTPVLKNARRITIQGKHYIMENFQDITQRKHAEQKLTESEERFRLIAHSVNDVFYEWNVESGTLQWFGDIHAALGYAADEIEFTIHNWLERIHPDDRPALDEVMSVHAVSVEPLHYEYRVIRKDGSERIWQDNAYPILNGDAVPVRWVGGISDITKKKKTEHSLAQKNKMESIGVLAGGIAHDFNNILAGIMGYSNVLKLKLEKGTFSSQNTLSQLDKIISACSRAKALTVKLLGFSRQGQYNPQNIDPNSIVSEVKNLVETQANIIGEKISIHTNARSFIYADETQLYQVIQNLVINAFDAGSIGCEVTISTNTVRVDEPFITHMGEIPSGEYVQYSVCDNGTGIQADVLKRIFEPFYTTKKDKGTGMGLAMVYGIIKNHNGYIQVETDLSAEHHGTAFHIYLPAVERENNKNIEITCTGQDKTGSILVIDDERIIREPIQEALELQGYTVTTASNGQEGIDAFLSGNFDIVLTDLIMLNGLSGIEVYKNIRALNRNVPICIMSGYQQDFEVQNILSDGANGFLAKPFTISELYTLVEKVLYNKKQINTILHEYKSV